MGLDRRDYKLPKQPVGGRPKAEWYKQIVALMWDGEWRDIPELQVKLKVRRSTLRWILKSMIDKGIMETTIDLSFERYKKKTLWLPADVSPDGKRKFRRRDALLPRNHRYYRLIKDNIILETQKEDPSE